jgi:amino acid transporter
VLWPDAKNPVYRLVILTVLIGGLAVINIRGVSGGTRLSNVLTVAKLLPLLIVVGWGFSYIYLHGSPVPPISESHSMSAWLNAVLLLIYAFTGFESALIPGGELKNASRDIPFALLASFPVVAIVYFLIQEVVVHLLPGASQTGHPLSAAAYVIGGSAMATIIGVGALLSSFGSLAANMTANPRLTLAFAEQGDFPRWFGSIHLRYRTPYISILVFTVVLWTLAVMGTFQWNAILSGISRLFAYGITCAALPVLRRRPVGKEAFRLPGGEAFAVLGILFALILLSRMGRSELIVLAITAGLSFLNWLAIRATSRLPQD